MKKFKIVIILSTLFLLPSCTFIRVKNPTSGKCVVNYLLEDQTGEYVKDESLSYTDTYDIGEFVRVRPSYIKGYTCITKENELCGNIPDISYLNIDIKYRKNYRSVIQNRIYSSFLPNSEFSCYGDTVYLYRTNEALPKVVVLDKDNCKFTTPDMSKSGSVDMTVTYEKKEYEVNYPYFVLTSEEVINTYRDLLKTKQFTVTHNYGASNNYTFLVNEEDYDLYSNPTISALFDKFKNDFTAHSNDKNEMEKDKKTFTYTLVKLYGAYAKEQISSVLYNSIDVLNYGVLATSGATMRLGSPNGYYADVYKDISMYNGDTRKWVPDAYKPYYILDYSNHLATDFNDPYLIRDLFYGLVNDAIKAVTNIIIERECYYAVEQNTAQGKPYLILINGGGEEVPISEFEYVWKYNSADFPKFDYIGHTNYDPEDCKEFRLQAPFFNPHFEGGYKGTDIETTNDNGNFMIRYQIDKMFN